MLSRATTSRQAITDRLWFKDNATISATTEAHMAAKTTVRTAATSTALDCNKIKSRHAHSQSSVPHNLSICRVSTAIFSHTNADADKILPQSAEPPRLDQLPQSAEPPFLTNPQTQRDLRKENYLYQGRCARKAAPLLRNLANVKCKEKNQHSMRTETVNARMLEQLQHASWRASIKPDRTLSSWRNY